VTGSPTERGGLRGHLRKLLSHSAVYGSADVFTNVINLLLTPVYTAYLGPTDYRDIALLALFAAVAKVVFRLGLDAAFFRVYYDVAEPDRRRLVGTVALFSGCVALLLFGVIAIAARPLAALLLDDADRSLWVVLVTADIFLGSFAFVPLNMLRIQERPGLFSAFSIGRHTVNTVLKVVFVVAGFGVTGVVASDAIATGLFAFSLLPILARHISLSFSRPFLREMLAFGLPKVPHGFMIQVQNLADRKILDLFVTRADVGIYNLSYGLGTGVKFALSAFAPAWEPFIYSQIGRPGAPQAIARVITYAWAAFLAAGLPLAVLAPELLTLLTPKAPEFRAGAPVVPVIVLAYLLHGLFLLTSVGIGIRKKTGYYPLITAVAATTNVSANFLLIPRLGMMGAAWATVLSYAVMAGMGWWISRRLYPLPLEHGRMARLVTAAGLSYALSLLAPTSLWPSVFVKCLILALFPVLLVVSGFLGPPERAWLRARLAARGDRPRA
jgi:O-antigen/teichoic acid export membrane protein